MTAVSMLRCVSPPRQAGSYQQVTVRGVACLRLGSRISPKAACKRRTSVTPDRVPASGSEKVHGHVFFLSKGFLFFWFFRLPAEKGSRFGVVGFNLPCNGPDKA